MVNKFFINLTNYPSLQGFPKIFILIKVFFHSLNSIWIERIPMGLKLRQREGSSPGAGPVLTERLWVSSHSGQLCSVLTWGFNPSRLFGTLRTAWPSVGACVRLQVWTPGVSVSLWISLALFCFFLASFSICFTLYPFCVTVHTWYCLWVDNVTIWKTGAKFL